MVTGAYYPEISGAGLQCRELMRALSGAVDFAVLTTTTDATLPGRDERNHIPIRRVFVDPARSWSKAAAAWRIGAAWWRGGRRCSILHLHGFSQKSILLIVLALATRTRIAIKLTSVGHDDPVSMKRRGPLSYWAYTRASLFFGVSPQFRRLYEQSGLPPARFRLIPNGVDVQRFGPATAAERRQLRNDLGFPLDVPVILFIGFFSREKAPDVLFDAWARLASGETPGSVLVFVGATRGRYYEIDPALADDIRSRADRLGLGGRIHFIESTHEVERVHRVADVFVLPSVREGLPNALLEAMACGTACIAARLPGVTDALIEDGVNGLLVSPGDVSALAAALSSLLTDPGRARAMGGRARQSIERSYGMARTAEQYLAAYRELMAS